MIKYKELAANSFFRREYKKALFNYGLALKVNPFDKEAKVGALLADLATEQEDEAVALFEYYETTKSFDQDNSDEIINEIVNGSSLESDYIFQLLDGLEEYIVTLENGVEYKDFLQLCEDKNSFKNALEDIMFSTKIIIHRKDDFIDFVNRLIENDYRDLALNYIENALQYYPTEMFFQKKLKQLEQKKH